MLFDAHNLFSDEQVVTASAASSNIVNIGKKRDIAVDNDLYLAVVNTGTQTGTGTVKIALQTASDSAFTSPTTLWESAALTTSELNDTLARFGVKLPHGADQYLRLYYTVTGTVAANCFKCGIVNGFDHHELYDKATHH